MPELPYAIQLPRELDPGQVKHAAEWADTFAGSDTNLAQRLNHNKDVLRYYNLADNLNQEAFQTRLLTDKVFATNYYKGLAEQRQQEIADSKLKMDTIKMQHDADMHPVRKSILEADLRATLAKTERDAANALLKKQQQTDADYDEANFAYGLSEARAQHGANTPEYHAAVLDLNERFPNAPEAFRRPHVNSAVAAEARRVEREQLKKQAAAEAAAAGLVETNVTGGGSSFGQPKGGTVGGNKPVDVTASEANKVVGQNALKELTRLESLMKGAGLSASSEWKDIEKAMNEHKIIAEDARTINHYIDQLKKSLKKDDRSQLETVYQGLKGKVQLDQSAVTPQGVDKKELARKALTDPNASEAHKAAARKILGQ